MDFKELLKNLGPLFTEQLAKLFDKLRLASPIAYVIVTGLVAGAAHVVSNNPDLLAGAPEWVEYIVIVISILTPILLSSRTKRHIPGEVEKQAGVQIKTLSADDAKTMQDFDD